MCRMYRAIEVYWWCERCGAEREQATQWNLSSMGRGVTGQQTEYGIIPEHCENCGGYGIKWHKSNTVTAIILETFEYDEK